MLFFFAQSKSDTRGNNSGKVYIIVLLRSIRNIIRSSNKYDYAHFVRVIRMSIAFRPSAKTTFQI